MNAAKVFFIIAIIYLSGFSAHAMLLKKTVYGDGIFYYSWVHSLVIDHDARFQNEYSTFGATQPTTPLGLPGNKYSIGPAILWSPLYLATHLVLRQTGYEFPYQFITGLVSVGYALTGLLLLFFILKKHFSDTVSLAAITTIAGATNLFFYGSLDVVNSHAVSFFAVTLFITLLYRQSRNWFLTGCALGLVGLCRSQDVIIGLLVIPYIKPKNILPFLSGALLFFIPQLAIWQILYGKFWISPYTNNIEGFNFLHPHILGVLFSPTSGLLLWTPIVGVGFYGLCMKNKLMAFVFIIQLYLIASWSIWWQGASYSGRMFIGMLPLITIGLAHFYTYLHAFRFRMHIIYWSIIIPLTLINFLSITFFLL
jgi:hypothetical protein